MTFVDGPLGNVAKTLVGMFGAPATISRKGEPSYDTETGQATAAETASISCELAPHSVDKLETIDGSLVRQDDRVGIVSRVRIGYTPEPNVDTITEGGETWLIVQAGGIRTGAEYAAFEVHLRRIQAGG